MKAVFNLARILQPSVIFFDEIDALMSARKVRKYQISLQNWVKWWGGWVIYLSFLRIFKDNHWICYYLHYFNENRTGEMRGEERKCCLTRLELSNLYLFWFALTSFHTTCLSPYVLFGRNTVKYNGMFPFYHLGIRARSF